MANVVHALYTRKIVVLLPALFAMLLRFHITYHIMAESSSIIMTSASVKDTIINTVAITFLVELNCIYWKVMTTVFHLKPDDITEVDIKILRRYARRECEIVFTKVIVFVLAMRQFAIVLYATDTDTDPVARGLCSYHRWETSHWGSGLYLTQLVGIETQRQRR